MTDRQLPNPASSISLGPEDTFLQVIVRQSNMASTTQWREVVGVAVHRRYGLWTHIYSCLFTATGRPVVHLVRVMRGDCLTEAVDWIAVRSAAPGILFARPPRSPAIRAGAIDVGPKRQQLGPAPPALKNPSPDKGFDLLPLLDDEAAPHGVLCPDQSRAWTQAHGGPVTRLSPLPCLERR